MFLFKALRERGRDQGDHKPPPPLKQVLGDLLHHISPTDKRSKYKVETIGKDHHKERKCLWYMAMGAIFIKKTKTEGEQI